MAIDVDPFSREFLADPYPHFRRLRDEAPVHYVEKRKLWMVTRWEDVNASARNHQMFSSTGGVGPDWNQRPMMPMYDPPEHTRMRRVLGRHFTPLAIKAHEPRIRALVEDLVATALEAGTVDFVDDIALPLSLGTVAELLGVPHDARKHMRRWAQGTVEELAGGLEPIPARHVDELRREFNTYLRSLIEERRATLAQRPGATDIITALVAATEDEKLSVRELRALCVLFMVAGFETTVNGIANGALALVGHPDQCRKVKQDRSLIPAMLEEAVRWDCPVLSFFRNTLHDVTLAGVTIPKGEKVMICFASGNRDERKFADPDAFRVERNPHDHLAYGAGIHYCLGAPLARLEMGILANVLFEQLDGIELVGPVERTGSVLFRGVKSMPVKLIPAAGVKRPAKSGLAAALAPAVDAPPPVTITPFRISVEQSVLDDLADRLRRTRWPDQVEWPGWDYGVELGALRGLVDYWRDGYDWRKHERTINEWPQFRARIGDLDVHFVHLRCGKPDALPLLVLHGWPGTFLLFKKLMDRLAPDFDLVVASLPGFPFSTASKQRGMGPLRIAGVMASLMEALGYGRYGVVAEDMGTGVATRMALEHPERVVGMHLNMQHEFPSQMKDLTTEEKAWLKDFQRVRERELTHHVAFRSSPQTWAYGLNDSPTGLAAVLLERYRAWSDNDGDVEQVFSKDDLLTNVMLHWVGGNVAASLRIYAEWRLLHWSLAAGERVEVPTAMFLSKKELVQPPRSFIERVHALEQLTHAPTGGHYTAWELPDAVAEDVRTFFAKRR